MLDGLDLAKLAPAPHRRTAHELVRDTLRRAIFSGVLTGGTHLGQAEIATQLAVSTTPVREALRDLAADGLIRIDPHRGAVVHDLDHDDLREIYEIRSALEPLAIRRAARHITADELAAAGDLLDRMARETDPAAWLELNWAFHALLGRASRSPRLFSLVTSAQGSTARYVGESMKTHPDRLAEATVEHRALVDALAGHDGDTCAKLVTAHLQHTLELLLAP
ncbi:GntR family transcriptional regulator [Asanoa ishikariensis]|uniref:Transcriptional regulator, GntR family n=1 Tax=Asanoa ishikariensis TaxID=137265 RepID=A0A1H3R4K3_9ACTN|nr:GntR family transcriptional regulator [Asanoa ishikariensis]GIF64407.1 GntR family transcriptional regulator [Asanoa ishikariensis]SDZ20772.1 transcriptional regulator, GntR family [Asanoa ishikariensis]